MPHRPANAVLVASPDQIHGPFAAGGGGSVADSGWPDRNRAISGSGPFAPIFIGVWQSLHAMMCTRDLPRAAWASPARALAVATASRAAIAATAPAVSRTYDKREACVVSMQAMRLEWCSDLPPPPEIMSHTLPRS